MKNLLLIAFIILSFVQISFTQSPANFSYQAVVRDNSGSTINNQAVSFQITIRKTTPTGTSVYSETMSATTNDFGLVNLSIGSGTVILGNLSTIDWSLDDFFVEVQLDVTGGTSYVMMGTSQLLSVPFAMYAKNSGDKVWAKNGSDAELLTGKAAIGTTASNYSLDVKAPATAGAEKAFRINATGATNDRFSIENGTNVAGRFLPLVIGEVNSYTAMPSLQFTATTQTTSDVGTTPMMVFDARKATTAGTTFPGTRITTRPLFQWRSYATNYMTMSALGNLGIGTTTPARKLHVSDAMRLEPMATPPSSPAAGDMYFSSAVNKLMVYDGSVWQACW